ncbi:hypothetical protein [Verrucosispora sp. NA02020]|uniref:hypothetical protein n=1 Tax=Verrucosispora sp. NA02020 TaxID=2742132 RepID=UPI0015929FB4|nr:hypothetical protein [Verrucosispora sp. NA02020]QKW15364.1 hypothetical protein HUT12_23100 [Verrucosispora sp. NA02020]
MNDITDSGRHCASDTRCRAYDHTTNPPTAAPVTSVPLCDPCLAGGERDTRALVYDYVDLEQLQAPSLSQALNMQPIGKAAPPMPLNGAAEALQAEIVHVATTWEEIIRDHTGLPPRPESARRPGRQLDDAIRILLPRLRQLAALPAADVYPTGCEDQPTPLEGWEAIHHLQHLHQRARGMLGRTHRTTHLPGTCSGCGQDQLHRDEPRHPEDPCDVYCAACHTTWPHDDYQQYVTQLVWPNRSRAAA